MITLALTILAITIGLAGSVYILVALSEAANTRIAQDRNRISGTELTWHSDMSGVVIEWSRSAVVLWGTRRWTLHPTMATIGKRTIPVVGYRVGFAVTGKSQRVTIWGLQADGSREALMQHSIAVRSSWMPLADAIYALTPQLIHDPGTRADIPDALKALTEQT